MIEREIEHQKQGRKGHLIFKTNALVDPADDSIAVPRFASRRASSIAGARNLLPAARHSLGVSEHIEVTSIIGRFLEHSRIYYFHNGGDEEVYLGSADLMPRNLDHRVEILFPLADEKLVARVRDELLAGYLSDTAKRAGACFPTARMYAGSRPTESPRSIARRSWIPKRRSGESHESAEVLALKLQADED